MIRLDGYYRYTPSPYEDSIANYVDKGFFHNAYLFRFDGTYIRAGKRLKIDHYDFIQSDFNNNNPNKYEVKDDKLIVTYHTGEKWEFDEVFSFISDRELLGKERLFFVPFDD